MLLHKEAHLKAFCGKIDYSFNHLNLLNEALTHRSYSTCHNERLEFLGDSILNCAIAGLIFRRFPDLTEGDLSRIRANLVNQQTLFEIALSLDLGNLIKFGDGEKKSGGNQRPSTLSDALEAVFGAVYLDSNFAEAEKVVLTLYMPNLQNLNPKILSKDPKTLLQEYLQRHKLALPAYLIVSTVGKAHKTQFTVTCSVPKLNILAEGEGSSRRSAEQEAAKHAYEQVCMYLGS